MANILVADDVDTMRRNIAKILKDQGHTIFEAANGLEVASIIQKEKIDVLILDVVMPKLGGTETLMRYQNELQGVKIVVISGKVSEESSAFSALIKQFGAKHFLEKPFRKKQLIEVIKDVLAA